MIEHDVVSRHRPFYFQIRAELFLPCTITFFALPHLRLDDVFTVAVIHHQIYASAPCLHLQMHDTLHLPHKLIEISKQQILPHIFPRLRRHLKNAEAGTPDEVTEVIQQPHHVYLSSRREVIAIPSAGILRVVVTLYPVHRRLERAQNAVKINRIRYLTHAIGALHEHPVGGKFTDNVIIQIEVYRFIIRGDLHQPPFKSRVAADIGGEMLDVCVAPAQQLPMCLSEVLHANRFGVGNVHLLGEELREAVHQHRLSRRLLIDILNNGRRERLPDFICILSEEFLHLCQREIRQAELILHIKRRNCLVIVELCDTLDTNDANAERTSGLFIGQVDVTQCMQKTADRVARDAIELINNEHHPLSRQQTTQLFKKFHHHKPVGEMSVF